MGIVDGDPVHIETPLGRIRQKANLTTGIGPGVVHADGYWWYPEMPGQSPCLHGVWESNANVLCPVDKAYCNVEIGGWPHTALLCKVSKVI